MTGAARLSAWTLADQALVSASAFAITLVVARATSPRLFGEFVLAYTGLLVLAGIHTALITQPHNVLGVSRTGVDYVRYTTATAVGQAALTVSASAAAGLGAAVALAVGSDVAGLLGATALANIGWQSLDFCRRVLYTEARPVAALAVDSVGYAGSLAAVAILAHSGRLTASAALVAIALATAVGGVAGLAFLRASLGRSADWSALRSNWRFGKWVGGARLLFWLSSSALVYLAAALAGAAAAGAIRAAQVVVGPLNVVVLALDTSLPSRFARVLHSEGRTGLARAVRRVYGITAAPVGIYCLVTVLAAGPLLRLLYGDKYADDEALVHLFALTIAFLYVAGVLASALYALQRTRAVFGVNVAGTAVGVGAGTILTASQGAAGAVAGIAAGAAVLALGAAVAYRRGLSGDADGGSAVPPDPATVPIIPGEGSR